MLKKGIGLLLAVCCVAPLCFAQGAAAPASVVPITKEPSHRLVFENEYVRVFKVEVAPHAETLYHKHDVDYVFVTLGDSDVESVRVGEPPVRLQLKDGETRFTKGGFAHKAVNNSDKPFVNVTVELKKDVQNSSEQNFLFCSGFACQQGIVTSSNVHCFLFSTAGSGTGIGLPTSANRLLIAVTEFREGAEHLMKSGDTEWLSGAISLKGIQLPLRSVICEFARPSEDFLRKLQ